LLNPILANPKGTARLERKKQQVQDVLNLQEFPFNEDSNVVDYSRAYYEEK